jgi:hypothetical protein
MTKDLTADFLDCASAPLEMTFGAVQVQTHRATAEPAL